MKTSRTKILLPAVSAAGSLFCLLAIVGFTNPVQNVGYALILFVALAWFLASLGFLVVTLQTGRVSRRARGRIVLFTMSILLLLMFRSAGSLSWTGGLILLLIVAGLLFYGSRRPGNSP